MAEEGESGRAAIRHRMGALITPAIGVINEIFAAYETMAVGLRLEEFTHFALAQFQHRFARIERARGAGALPADRDLEG